MKNRNEKGFSLIELLIVVVIIGIVAALAVPALQKGIRAAENGNTFGSMRSMTTTQLSYFTQNSRFARLSELNSLMSNSLGTVSGDTIVHGKFVFEMAPAAPTDAELRQGYTITATRNVTGEGIVYKYEITQTGEIRQILP
jgi:prepilin-type N-terminal cleavage/methylation domain-containing protein